MTAKDVAPLMALRATWERRFWSHVAKSDERSDCWPWLGIRGKGGYGQFPFKGKLYPAPRIALAMRDGAPDPELVTRHACDNPECVNPDHLLFGTQSENARDWVERKARRGKPRGTLTVRERIAYGRVGEPPVKEFQIVLSTNAVRALGASKGDWITVEETADGLVLRKRKG